MMWVEFYKKFIKQLYINSMFTIMAVKVHLTRAKYNEKLY